MGVPDPSVAIQLIDELIEVLFGPLTTQMQSDGWTARSAAATLDYLERLRSSLRQAQSQGSYGPEFDRQFVRSLDSWGVNRGSLLDKAARVENELRRLAGQ
jgi:hypothetical protein